jgi:hypothetical protein
MSSFKKLNKSDVTVVPYHANKQWKLPFDIFPTNRDYLVIYKGTNLTGQFSPDTDPVTAGQYERLVYAQINQLFYQTYSSSLNTSSLANSLYYESASESRPTGSYFVYNENPNLIKKFPTGSNDGIRVLAFNQDIYGNKILPNHFVLSSSAYYVTDDGYGNLFDTKTTKTHIGNIFYPQGIAVITTQSYQTMFPLPPLAVNDTQTFSNSASKQFTPLLNDISIARGGIQIVNSSIALSGSATDLSKWSVNGSGVVTLTTTVPGTYDIYYTFDVHYNEGDITSNQARIRAIVI